MEDNRKTDWEKLPQKMIFAESLHRFSEKMKKKKSKRKTNKEKTK